jgi:hypothetical protein
MKMPIKGLWPDNLKAVMPTNGALPEEVLAVQAQDLSQKTGKILEGQIERKSQGEWLTLDFYAVVPALDNYAYHLLKVRHKMPPYPAQIFVPGMNGDKPILAKDARLFENHLRIIFRSPHLRKVLGELMAYAEQKLPKR